MCGAQGPIITIMSIGIGGMGRRGGGLGRDGDGELLAFDHGAEVEFPQGSDVEGEGDGGERVEEHEAGDGGGRSGTPEGPAVDEIAGGGFAERGACVDDEGA